MKLEKFKLRIPEEVKTLFFIKIFTTYSFAVLYSSLVLYMTNHMKIPSISAAGIVGTFISLNFLLHFLGGYLGGKYISNRLLFSFGILLEIIGLLLLPLSMLTGLGVFLTGSGLYVTSINAILLQKYESNETQRELGSFWLYSGMNIGFFVGHTVSGYFHLTDNYNFLFNTAILSSLIAIFLMFINWNDLTDKTTELTFLNKNEKKKRNFIFIGILFMLIPFVNMSLGNDIFSSSLVLFSGGSVFLFIYTLALNQKKKSDKKKIFAFLILTISGIVFWSLFFIGPMGLMIFIDRYVEGSFLGIAIPPQWFNNINTVIIVVGGPFLGMWFKKKRDEGNEFSVPFLFSLALLLIGTAFILLPLAIYMTTAGQKIAVGWIALSFILQTLGELFLSPVGVAMIGQLAPKGRQGLLLGAWSMVSGIASMLSKHISQWMVISDQLSVSKDQIVNYSTSFSQVGWIAIGAGAMLMIFAPAIQKLIEYEDN